MIAAILLAAGKGTRIKSKDRNKVTLPFLNKPLIVYGVDLMNGIADKTIVVVGAFHESVKEVLEGHDVVFAYQHNQLGTAHAVKAGLLKIDDLSLNPESVIICYGDHTMFYKRETVQALLNKHENGDANLSLLTTHYPEPNRLAWGRIIRDKKDSVIAIVEQKDATEEQKKITEINPGFYVVRTNFLWKAVYRIDPSPVSGEYYITDLIKIAVEDGERINTMTVPFNEVGIGINKIEELEESQKIYIDRG